MKVAYRKLFLKDLYRLRNTDVYGRIKKLVFETLPDSELLCQIRPPGNMRGRSVPDTDAAGRLEVIRKAEGAEDVSPVLPFEFLGAEDLRVTDPKKEKAECL